MRISLRQPAGDIAYHLGVDICLGGFEHVKTVKKPRKIQRIVSMIVVTIFIEAMLCFSYAETFKTESAGSDNYELMPLYVDKETNTTFMIPDNWKSKPPSKENIDAKFVPKSADGFMYAIMYGSADIYGQEMKDAGYLRADINNTLVPKEYVSYIMNIDESGISVARYNNCDYYRADIVQNYSSDGLEVNVEMTFMVRFENGYMYVFQFFGTSDSEYFDDFESLLNSAVYPAA